MIRAWLLALLLWPAAAHADPITAVAFLAPFIGGAAAAFIVTNAATILFYAAVAGYGINRQNAAKRKARAAYNDSLRDRLQMTDLQPDQARTIAMGRVRTVEGIRRRWSSGANSEKLTLIVSFAGHEIDSFEQFYWADTALTLDGSGYVTTAPFGRTTNSPRSTTVTLNGSGGGAFVLPSLPVGGTVQAFIGNGGTGIDYLETALGVSVAGSTATLSGGGPGDTAQIIWQTAETTSLLRIRPYLGTASQNVGSALAAEYPGKITATDRFAGIALAVVDLTYDPDIYPQGLQAITAVLRGAKVYDPRLDSTNGGSGSQRLATPSTWTWSQNPALHAYHYARLTNGWAVPAAEIRTADVIAAANQCDISTNFTLRKADGSTSVVTLPRHQSGIVIPTDADPAAMMGEIMEAMAGRQGWAGGTWRMRAGVMASSAFSLDSSWIAQRLDSNGNADGNAVVRISNGVQRADKVNRVTGTCVDRDQRYQALPFPGREDAVLIAAEGAYPLEVEYQAVSHVAHAQHLASIAIRESQAALRMELSCNLSGYRCELFDVGSITLARYGMTAKTMEITGWRWHPAEGVKLTMAEITSAIFTPLAELVGRDPAPDSSLPAPWTVETITGVGVTSGTVALVDGSIITRTRVAWTAAVSQAIRRGGRIEVQYTPAAAVLPTGDWPSWIEQGDSTSAVIPGLLSRYYVFRVRAVNSLRVRGAWSAQVLHYVAQPADAQLYDLRLGTRAITLQATSAGVVSSFAGATATVQVMRGTLDNTASWTLSRTNGTGMSSTLSAGVLTVTAMSSGTDSSYIDITATRSGYADLVGRITIAKSKAGGDGNAIVFVFKRAATIPATPTGNGTPATWSLNAPAADGNPLWMSKSEQTAAGVLVGSWSTPVQFEATPPAGPVLTGYARVSNITGSPVTCVSRLRLNNDGNVARTLSGSSAVFTNFATPWYTPATGTPGNSYWVRFVQRSGTAVGGAALNTWLALTSDQPITLTATSLTSRSAIVDYQIAVDSAGATVVAAGTFDLYAESS